MLEPADDIDCWEDDLDYGGDCPTCWGQGYIIVCIDDLCRNSDHCIHGDGEEPCPDCEGWYF